MVSHVLLLCSTEQFSVDIMSILQVMRQFSVDVTIYTFIYFTDTGAIMTQCQGSNSQNVG